MSLREGAPAHPFAVRVLHLLAEGGRVARATIERLARLFAKTNDIDQVDDWVRAVAAQAWPSLWDSIEPAGEATLYDTACVLRRFLDVEFESFGACLDEFFRLAQPTARVRRGDGAVARGARQRTRTDAGTACGAA